VTYAEAFAAIADPTRRRVFERLRAGPLAVGRLARGLGVTRPAVSQHLRVLERARLVRARREGTRRIYAIDPRGLQELRRYLDRFWDDVLGSFAAGSAVPEEAEPAPRARKRASRSTARRPRPRP
jgi:DNA-binding transcriptional ArsR family regulator